MGLFVVPPCDAHGLLLHFYQSSNEHPLLFLFFENVNEKVCASDSHNPKHSDGENWCFDCDLPHHTSDASNHQKRCPNYFKRSHCLIVLVVFSDVVSDKFDCCPKVIFTTNNLRKLLRFEFATLFGSFHKGCILIVIVPLDFIVEVH